MQPPEGVAGAVRIGSRRPRQWSTTGPPRAAIPPTRVAVVVVIGLRPLQPLPLAPRLLLVLLLFLLLLLRVPAGTPKAPNVLPLLLTGAAVGGERPPPPPGCIDWWLRRVGAGRLGGSVLQPLAAAHGGGVEAQTPARSWVFSTYVGTQGTGPGGGRDKADPRPPDENPTTTEGGGERERG